MKARPGDEGRQFTAHDDAMKPWRAYAERGMKVFPVHSITERGRCTCGNPACKAPGKHPRIGDWENAATDDLSVIAQWVRRWPVANIGWALGRDGCGAIDVDFRNGGAESFACLEQRLGSLDTTRQISGSGSEHHIVAVPKGVELQSRSQAFGSEYPGVDFKTGGGCIIVPPSKHQSGGVYTWDAGSPPVQDLPRVWVDALLAQQNGKVGDRRPIGGIDDGVPLKKGARHDEMIRYAGRCAQTGMNEEQVLQTLVVWGENCCDAPYTKAEVETELRAAADSAVRKYGKRADGQTQRATGYAERGESIEWEPLYPFPSLDEAALYGVAGEIVGWLAPQTEAHPAALLLTLLTAVGNAMGPNSYAEVHDDRHPPRLFTALVGATSSGGKGTADAAIRPIYRQAAPEWFEAARHSGFASGEAVIAKLGGTNRTPGDDSPIEHRLLNYEPELARLLAIKGRDGSRLSGDMRDLYDSGVAENNRSKVHIRATGAHFSVLSHITPEELRLTLAGGDIYNGFANRFFFACVKRVREVPEPTPLDTEIVAAFAKRLSACIEFALERRTCERTPEAKEVWAEFYHAHTKDSGVVGSLLARTNTFRLRLSVLFSLLDRSPVVRAEHVIAAEAVVRYGVDSVRYLFSSYSGGSTVDRLLAALRKVYKEGLDGTARLRHFGNNKPADEVDAALQTLVERGKARIERDITPGGGPEKVTAFAVRAYEERIAPCVPLVVRRDSYTRRDGARDSSPDEPATSGDWPSKAQPSTPADFRGSAKPSPATSRRITS